MPRVFWTPDWLGGRAAPGGASSPLSCGSERGGDYEPWTCVGTLATDSAARRGPGQTNRSPGWGPGR